MKNPSAAGRYVLDEATGQAVPRAEWEARRAKPSAPSAIGLLATIGTDEFPAAADAARQIVADIAGPEILPPAPAPEPQPAKAAKPKAPAPNEDKPQ